MAVCYAMMGRIEKAKELLSDEIAKKPTPELWCTLGGCSNVFQMIWVKDVNE
tara:strand:- start:91 stop:246 length:156 start_codon:yes stop_codon:yes gene_type:complete